MGSRLCRAYTIGLHAAMFPLLRDGLSGVYPTPGKSRDAGWRKVLLKMKTWSGRSHLCYSLFISFLRLGCTAFGGPAMVAYIRDLAVEKKGWLDGGTFRHGVAVCQSIPGATAMQVAAYVGLRAGGAPGALAAYVGFLLPAFFLMVALAGIYGRVHDLAGVVAAFKGLQVVVVALVANAFYTFGRSSIKIFQDGLLALGAALFLVLHGSPVVAIVASALLGLLLYRQIDAEAEGGIGSGGHPGLWNILRLPLLLVALVFSGLVLLFFLDRQLFQLAALMLKVDCFAFGGGYASVPLMLHAVVVVHGWLDSSTFMDGIALGQVTPGPIVITATFVGFLLAGFAGALIGTAAIFTPSFIMLLAAVPSFDRLATAPLFQRALRGALVSFVGLLLAVTIQFALAIDWGWVQVLLVVAALTAFRMRVDIFWVVLVGAAVAAVLL